MNTAGARAVRLDGLADSGVERDRCGLPTGRVFGLDGLIRERIGAVPPDLAALGRELVSYGVTGVTDLTPTDDANEVEVLAAQATTAAFPVAVTVTGGVGLPATAAPSLPRGPVKLLPADHGPLDPDAIAIGIEAAHRAGRPVAIHCVTRIGLVVALAAWREVGVRPGDRVEHGAVIPDDVVGDLRELGLVVVTQPNLVAERGDRYLDDVEPADLPHLWRCGSLLRSGIEVAGGTDAPFGHPDPWRAIAAAVERRTEGGRRLGPDEAIAASRALAMFLGNPLDPTVVRRVVPGSVSDLCLLDRPLNDVLVAPTSGAVSATLGRGGLAQR